MKARSPQIGRYKVFKAYYEIPGNRNSAVAEGIFMEFDWNKFDLKLRKIRLRSLYNSCSEGPKQEFPLENLNNHYLLIHDMYEDKHPTDPQKTNYCVLWEVEKPMDYEEVVQQESELAMDFVLQEMVIASNYETLVSVLEGMEIDEMLSNEIDDINWLVQVDPEEEY